MEKLALLIGINYRHTAGELSGCINDTKRMQDLLENHFNYDPRHITLLTDDTEQQPTRENILTELITLAEKSHKYTSVKEIWFLYSGHGTYVHDTEGDEDDGRDECLVPLDYVEAGLITDDEINSVLALVRPGVKFIGLVDACHSETMFDLPYRFVAGNKYVIESDTSRIKCDCVMISGCKDSQTSADAYGLTDPREYSGAMNAAFLAALKVHNYTITFWQLLKHMRRFLAKRTFKQRPQITTNLKLRRHSLMTARPNESFVSSRS